ncbi:MAG TPA: tRNA lysidine(34) synthetase TilS [Actinomycetota bacterium]|nr:tRNA lysidine(34) synthetase TilS [Actinomycetota bacterium]
MSQEPRAVRDLVATVRRTIQDRGLFKGGEHTLLAVSGGPDSLAMLHVFARLAPLLDLELHVAHFDHRLRDGSGADAAFVARQAAALGLPATVRAAEDTGRIPGKSPEETARDRRQSFLQEVAEGIGAVRIATAHTMDDQAETILMRMLFGTGPRGLGGITPLRWWYVRPLIDARRAQTVAFCRALRLRPRIDPTNDDPAFRRNVIRNETIPFVRSTLNAGLTESIARLGDILRDEDHYLHGLALSQAPPEPNPGGGSRLPVESIQRSPVPIQRRAIRYLFSVEGYEAGAAQTEAVRRLVVSDKTSGSIDLAGPLSARLEYGFLVVSRAPSPAGSVAPVELAVPGETELPPWGARARTWISSEHPASMPDGTSECVVDADRVSFPLRVRRWRSGDRFRPLGMNRQKKVGDFFTDEKVSRAVRGEVPLIVDDDGTICWIVGHRIDDRAKVSARTQRFLWIEFEGE